LAQRIEEPLSPRRRAVIKMGLAAILQFYLPHVACAPTEIDWSGVAGSRRFSVLYRNHKIGAHTVTYSSETGEMRVDTEVHLLVKVAFFTVFAFRLCAPRPRYTNADAHSLEFLRTHSKLAAFRSEARQ
jgi:hypothetical protein